ncbi:MAG: hypothetical protein A4C66_10725 [Nitrospira sp. HN-bin3]|uniref:hypothetical protein n=1 Tax=Nitrospira cf. moscoviensis SBR1015 TaxID=96242 RepID=UPI000A0C688E|nr:hypothetical protein [Nitrospira cf. moscoviensis SBR1015]OQW40300.1 MAG: hypothetical protein A4C66_10725 [Nitrospira sp. HN-bin3]
MRAGASIGEVLSARIAVLSARLADELARPRPDWFLCDALARRLAGLRGTADFLHTLHEKGLDRLTLSGRIVGVEAGPQCLAA